MIAVDGTKVPGNASRDANLDYEQIAQAILEQAKAVDAAEDELYGVARGDELPEQLRTGEGRRAWLREAKRQLEEQRNAVARASADETAPSRPFRQSSSVRLIPEITRKRA